MILPPEQLLFYQKGNLCWLQLFFKEIHGPSALESRLICQEGQMLQTCPELQGSPSFFFQKAYWLLKILILWQFLWYFGVKNHIDGLKEENHPSKPKPSLGWVFFINFANSIEVCNWSVFFRIQGNRNCQAIFRFGFIYSYKVGV